VVGVDRNYGARNKEHAPASLLLTAADRASLFYTSYPPASTEVEIARRGYFGSLGLFVGLGFTRINLSAVEALCFSTSPEGVLKWSDGALDRIGSVAFAGCSSLEEKQLHMAGYLFELVYGLMISPRGSVSRSHGFETPRGIFGGGCMAPGVSDLVVHN
jgi:hypothetical protein